MNVREGFLFVVLSFLACSVYGAMNIGGSGDTWCSELTQKHFSVRVYSYDQSNLKHEDIPPKIKESANKTMEGEDLEFQEDRAKVIHITAYNPETFENEESYLIDDTYFFPSFLAVAELINKSRQGQSITKGEINGAKLLLNELEETIDEVDDDMIVDMFIEQNVRKILKLLDREEGEPLDIEALSVELDKMGLNNHYHDSGKLSSEKQIHLRGYERNREREKDESGSDVWGWEPFTGPNLYYAGGRTAASYKPSLADQFFNVVHHNALSSVSQTFNQSCSRNFVTQSTLETKNVLTPHRSVTAAIFDTITFGGDSRTEDVPVSVQRNNKGSR